MAGCCLVGKSRRRNDEVTHGPGVIGGTVHLSYSACVNGRSNHKLPKFRQIWSTCFVQWNWKIPREEMRAKFDASDMHALRCVEMMAEMQKAHWIGFGIE